MGIAYAAEGGIALVIHITVIDDLRSDYVGSCPVPDRRMAQKRPDLRQCEVQDGVDAHEARPEAVGHLEGVEGGAVGVGAPRADEDCAAGGVVMGEVEGEGVAEGDDLGGVRGWVVGSRGGSGVSLWGY